MARSVAQSRASIARLQYLVLTACLVGSGAQAGAWTPERGHTNVILSSSISQTPVANNAVTTDLYYERGLGYGWALVLAPSVSDQSNVFARNEAQVSIRRALYEQDGWALSAQVGAYVWKEDATRESSTGVEYRLAGGKSFGDGGWVNVEAATRQCGGDGSLRWEGTIGYKVRNYDRAILKVFGDAEGCAANISRVQASYVYGLTENVGIELGWRETLPNAGNWNERGGVVGLWLKF
jgi:protein XagA